MRTNPLPQSINGLTSSRSTRSPFLLAVLAAFVWTVLQPTLSPAQNGGNQFGGSQFGRNQGNGQPVQNQANSSARSAFANQANQTRQGTQTRQSKQASQGNLGGNFNGNGRFGGQGGQAGTNSQAGNNGSTLPSNRNQIPLPDVRKTANKILPQPFPELAPAHVQYLDQLLNYWETNSQKIKRYHCKFTNWTYNSMQVPMKDPKSNHVFAQTISTGTVKFAAPDKGLFHSEKVWAFDRDLFAQKQDPFKESPELRQRWHCDGKSVYEFLYARKELVETPIPKEMQGERIVDGPLPFLFGAKADDLKRRYWIRVITPKERGEKGEYWLEAYPKYRQDAANFQKVEIILEKSDFLPAVLTLYSPEHDLRTGRIVAKQTIRFDKRKIWESENGGLGGFGSLFDELTNPPKTPFNWKRVNTQLRDTARNNSAADLQRK